jgi:membrane fusion protein, multidrug efflux system
MTLRTTTIAALAVVAAIGCSGNKQKPRDEVVPVVVAVAQQKDMPVQIRAIGRVEPLQTVEVHALVTGQLLSVLFHEGQEVSKGERLFQIDPKPYEAALSQAQANLARDQAQLRNAESQAARYEELVKKDYVTKEDYERFTSGAAAARGTVDADRAAVENARLQLSYCDIRSPMNGRTGSLQVHPGNIVHANDPAPLVVINQISPIYVTFAIPEAQLADLRARGMTNIPVTAMSQQGSVTLATGKLTFINNTVDATTGTITLKATFANENRSLWPGQFVTVAVTLADRPNAVVVPSQAVQAGQRGQYIYVVKQDKSVDMRPVQVVESDEQQAVIGSGVRAGETVVTDGQLRLTPKSKVEIKSGL